MFKKLRLVLGVLVAAGALSAATADAAYSGTTTRTFCPSSATPRAADRAYWDNGVCYSVVSDSGSPSTYHYARMALPVDRASTTTTATINAYGNTTFSATACAQGLVYDKNESLVSSTSADCNTTYSNYGSGSTLLSKSVTVGPNDYLGVSLAGQHATHQSAIKVTWTADGS